MNYFLNTPLQIPLPMLSPFLTSKQNFPSPFISPYAGPQENNYQHHDPQSEDDFANFQLDQIGQKNNHKQSQEESNTPIQQQEVEDVENKDEEQEDDNIQDQGNCETSQKIKRIINFLVKNVDKSDQKLTLERNKFATEYKQLGQVFDILVKKLRKLKKTKQEMTKYCMRKAFKFLAEKHKKLFESKDTSDFLKEYFQHMESESFSIPFKKNSEEKTMNTNFLKKIFSSLTFVSDYKQFLKSFAKVVQEDNNKKVKYLTSNIKLFLNNHSLKKLETVKRLPWTQVILDKTIDLANKLIQHSSVCVDEYQVNEKCRKASSSNKRSPSNSGIIMNRKKSAMTIPELPSPSKSNYKNTRQQQD